MNKKPKPGCTRASRHCHNKTNKLLFFHTLQRGTRRQQQQLADIVATRRKCELETEDDADALASHATHEVRLQNSEKRGGETAQMRAFHSTTRLRRRRHRRPPFASFLPGPFPSDSFLLTAFFPLPRRTSRSFCPPILCVRDLGENFQFFGKISPYYNRKTHIISADSFLIFFHCPEHHLFFFSQFCMSEIWATFSKILAKLVDFDNREETHISPDSILFKRRFFFIAQNITFFFFFPPNFVCPKFGRHFPKFWQN
jgi:hypothetical protein